MDRNELCNLLTLFLVSVVVVNTDLGDVFPMSLFSTLAYLVALLVMILVPAYLFADGIVDIQELIRSSSDGSRE
ncbi:hypothetical protein C499_19112 [Halogeometricum borinquense DSM 11551]|uniref:Uncharacterized protein n=2 Tax=Halogeometricum borinquense TaxID=60847 RepID=E4NN91_HALBP|nr:hypothetical protein [Halogeometricum borinquense]ADQ67429.1 hypothetical protein Hbor_18620 [Halogeometricum borinquense DSM 11551]ELY23296.1 hypothetical protein C499_19112 [Halogeometricum borinquense DSM 11551]RYJ14931.1 hypothetical protein ELS19_13840 [Halogeometricum borinquense]